MKSGTTTLYDYLVQHPQICPCVIKEPEYFSQVMGQSLEKKKKLKQMAYTELFDMAPEHHFTLDASTGYTKFPTEKGVPERIFNYGIRPKFIYVLRDPIERIRSHYNYMIRRPEWQGKIDAPHLVDTSNYYLQLNEYLNFFPKQDFLLIDFKELVKQPSEVCNMIFKFIGASTFSIEEHKEAKNVTQAVNPKKRKLLSKLGFLRLLTPKPLRTLGRKVIESLLPSKQKLLSEKQIRKINQKLHDDMLKLKDEFGFPVAQWGFEKK